MKQGHHWEGERGKGEEGRDGEEGLTIVCVLGPISLVSQAAWSHPPHPDRRSPVHAYRYVHITSHTHTHTHTHTNQSILLDSLEDCHIVWKQLIANEKLNAMTTWTHTMK